MCMLSATAALRSPGSIPSAACAADGAAGPELRDIERLVSEHERDLHEAWNGFFTG